MEWWIPALVLMSLSTYVLYRWMQRATKKLTAYFYDSTLLYVYADLSAARTAATAAFAMATDDQRETMASYLKGMESGLTETRNVYSDETQTEVRTNLAALISDIEKTGSSTMDVHELKTRLEKDNPMMLKALNAEDGGYFRRAYPKFFKK